MSVPLRVLILEDRPADAELFLAELRRAGFNPDWRRVDTESDYLAHLDSTWDVILADYRLPQFDAAQALRLLQARDLDIPFIIVSGTIGEEDAVAIMKEGAADYLLKDRLTRLGTAVAQTLERQRLRDNQRQAEMTLRQSEERFRRLAENAQDLIYRYRLVPTRGFEYVSPAATAITGYTPEEHYADPDLGVKIVHPDDRPVLERYFQGEGTFRQPVILRWVRKDGATIWTEQRNVPIHDETGTLVAIEGIARDVTERKRAEESLRKLSRAVEQSPSIVVITDTNEIIEYVNPTFRTITGFSPDEVVGTNATLLGDALPREEYQRLLQTITSGGTWHGEFMVQKKGGGHYWELATVSAIRAPDGTISHYIKVAEDITERKRAEAQIRRQLEHLSALRTIDLAITASLDLRVALNVILDQVTSQLKVDAANVLLFNPATQTLRYALNRGFRTRALQHTDLRLGEGHAGRAALERQTVHVSNLPAKLAEFSRSSVLREEGFLAYVAVPLIAKGQVKGVLEIFHRAPLSPDPEWGSFLEALAGQAAVAMDNATLFSDLQRANVDLTLAYDTTLEGWSRAMDLRDKETEGHTQRVAELTLQLARAMGMSEAELVHVRRGALLHDIGKMGIPDSILLKPGPLTDEEWEIMRRHPIYAYELLSPIPNLRPALDIPYCHHEKWDGTGYPRHLKGEQIPLAARIFAVVDVWDALTSDRPYRPAWTDEAARQYIREQAGKHFNPKVVDVFLGLDL